MAMEEKQEKDSSLKSKGLISGVQDAYRDQRNVEPIIKHHGNGTGCFLETEVEACGVLYLLDVL